MLPQPTHPTIIARPPRSLQPSKVGLCIVVAIFVEDLAGHKRSDCAGQAIGCLFPFFFCAVYKIEACGITMSELANDATVSPGTDVLIGTKVGNYRLVNK